jgi:predicted PurR-regulated permease PerM
MRPEAMDSGPSTRNVVRMSLAVAGTAGGLYLLYMIRGVLVLILLGLFLALGLGPLVEFLVVRRIPRVAAILAAYLALLASLVFLGLVAIPPIAGQIDRGVRQLPAGIVKLRENRTFRRYDDKYEITRTLEIQARKLPSRLTGVAKQLSAITVGAFSTLTKLISVLALGFFLLRDGPRLADRVYRGPDQEERMRRLGSDIYRSVSGYVAGNIAISVVAGLVAYVALTLLDVAFAAPLAVIVGVFDLLPLVGATIAAIIVGVVTLFYSFPTTTIVWAVVVIVYQQIENNVLSPIVYRRTVQVPGMLVLVSVLIGATLGGVIGALLAIPVAAAIQIVARDVWQQRSDGITRDWGSAGTQSLKPDDDRSPAGARE